MWQLVFGMLVGAIVTLSVQLLLIKKYLSRSNDAPLTRTRQFDDYKAPQEMQDLLSPEVNSKLQEALWAVNALLQFMFQEHKDANPAVRHWVLDKIKAECDELLDTSKVGRIVKSIKVSRVFLGDHFPTLRSAILSDLRMSSDRTRIEGIEITSDVTYSGGCKVVLDISLPLGKSFQLSVKVKAVRGTARLCFTRTPYTHWWFAFESEPVLDLEVHSHLQGRSIPQITALLVNQIKKVIRRKHTVPSYKMRLKPFFSQLGKHPTSPKPSLVRRTSEVEAVITAIVVSRLPAYEPPCRTFYCALALGNTKYGVDPAKSRQSFMLSHDSQYKSCGLRFSRNAGAIGEDGHPVIVVSRVVTASPAQRAGVAKNDVVLSIDGTIPMSCEHAEKLLEKNDAVLQLEIEREVLPANAPVLSKPRSDVAPVPSGPKNLFASGEALNDFHVPALDDRDELERRLSTGADDYVVLTSTEPPADGNSPGAVDTTASIGNGVDAPHDRSSPPSVRRRSRVNDPDNTGAAAGSGIPSPAGALDAVWRNCSLRTHKVHNLGQPFIKWQERLLLSIKEEHLFLVVFVIGVTAESEQHLLGYVNVSLPDVIAECEAAAGNEYQLMLSLGSGTSAANHQPCTASLSTLSTRIPSGARGLEKDRAGGDVTLRFRLHNSPDSVLEWYDDDGDDVIAVAIAGDAADAADGGSRQHSFATKLFQQATYCDFCTKKVWLKNALQCTACSMVCHKKCLDRCRTQAGTCRGNRTEAASVSPRDAAAQQLPDIKAHLPSLAKKLGRLTRALRREPESVLAKVSDFTREAVNMSRSVIVNSQRGSTLQLPLNGSEAGAALRRTHSASALESACRQTPLGQSAAPSASAAHLLLEAPACSGDEASTDEEGELEFQFNHFLKQQGAAADNVCPDEAAVLTAAKEMGKEVYCGLDPEERRLKLEAMVAKLQHAIGLESRLKFDVESMLQHPATEAQRRAINDRITKSDEKIKALAVLQLYYVSGLQHCLEQMEDGGGTLSDGKAEVSCKKDV